MKTSWPKKTSIKIGSSTFVICGESADGDRIVSELFPTLF